MINLFNRKKGKLPKKFEMLEEWRANTLADMKHRILKVVHSDYHDKISYQDLKKVISQIEKDMMKFPENDS